MKNFIYSLGDKVKDKVTGFKGVVVVRSQYLTGCNRYGLQNQKLSEKGQPADWQYFDEDLLVTSGANLNITIKVPGGPPKMEAPQR